MKWYRVDLPGFGHRTRYVELTPGQFAIYRETWFPWKFTEVPATEVIVQCDLLRRASRSDARMFGPGAHP